ncbi:L-pipecolate oxidase-like protein [Emericellopsis cladophorae]|uniref:L-pipecolate oxidase-like protein n=1 Tax=Emericellopsis cladophorae TaxID=2686198 RepID=A0A9Q0BGY5_9HYPO|nr:L-pipecolate oxidase-like protein [Emericellopsis cladophorae]KAI6784476.1 L-pipecolate oxidase-like protein [Emericellopsis cladophorae]
MQQTPDSILIVGSGLMGLTTAWTLTKRPRFANTTITIVDHSRGTSFPPEDAASVDTSRIIRADYADPDYAAFAAEAQAQWRQPGDDKVGGQGRYSESGMVVMAEDIDGREKDKKTGMEYVKASWENVASIAKRQGHSNKVRTIEGRENLKKIVGTDGNPGTWGYVNQMSGWADNAAGMRWLYEQVRRTNRVKFVDAEVKELVTEGKKVVGARVQDGRVLRGDIVYLAAGAWTGALIDLRGRCEATGHVLGYIDITQEEQEIMDTKPIMINFATGHFVIPAKHRLLKVARHGFGYLNPVVCPNALPLSPEDDRKPIVASIPRTARDHGGEGFPAEADADLRKALTNMCPLKGLETRPWAKQKICWYSDTRDADWLVDWHPNWENLFVVTGDSGHGFKFLPVIGDKLVDVLEGKGGNFANKWRWKDVVNDACGRVDENGVYKGLLTWDGSRGGEPGMILAEEFKKGGRAKL